MSFAAHTHAFLLSIYLVVEWLGHRVCIYAALGDAATWFSKVGVPVHTLSRSI